MTPIHQRLSVGVISVKGAVHPKLIFHQFPAHRFVDGGFGDIFQSTLLFLSLTDGKNFT